MGQNSHATPPAATPAEIQAALESDDPARRREALQQFQRLLDTDRDAALDLVDSVGDCLGDESLAVCHAAARSLEPVVTDSPELLVDHLEAVVEMLAAETSDVSLAGAKLLSVMAVECPGALVTHADRLREILVEAQFPTEDTEIPDTIETRKTREIVQNVQQEDAERRQFVRQTLANVLVAVVESEPDTFEDVAGLEGLLEDEDAVVVGAIVDALGVIAKSRPGVVRPTVPSLLDCLDHETPTVRARTIRTLGYVGDSSAVEPLRERGAVDTDEDVADLATETAAFLEET